MPLSSRGWLAGGQAANPEYTDLTQFPCRVGEGRACWSLGNAYVSMGSPAQALTFAKKHLEISQEVSTPVLPVNKLVTRESAVPNSPFPSKATPRDVALQRPLGPMWPVHSNPSVGLAHF